MVNPQEEARISVCANPAATPTPASEISFSWKVEDMYYTVFFDGQGAFKMMRERHLSKSGWRGSDKMEWDIESRMLIFK